MNTWTSVSDAGGALEDSHLLPVAGFSNKHSHPWTWWSLHIPHVGPVLHLLHRGYCTAPSPMCTHRRINTQNTHTHTYTECDWGLSFSIMKTRSGRSGRVEWGSNYFLSLLISTSSLRRGFFVCFNLHFSPQHPHMHTPPSLPVSLKRLRAKQGRTEHGGTKEEKSSKG